MTNGQSFKVEAKIGGKTIFSTVAADTSPISLLPIFDAIINAIQTQAVTKATPVAISITQE